MENNVAGINPINTLNVFETEVVSQSEETTSSESTSTNNTPKSTSGSSNKSEAREKLEKYQKTISDIYSTSISESSIFPENIQFLICQIKTSYCNTDIISLDFDKSKENLNTLIDEFCENSKNLNASNYMLAINKMASAIAYTKDHTEKWLRSALITDEYNNNISGDEYKKRISQFNEYFTEVLTKFGTIRDQVNSAKYKNPLSILTTNEDDVNNIPTDFSSAMALLKESLGEDANYLTFEGAEKPEDLAKQIKKIETHISDLLTKDYVKFFNGKSSDEITAIADRIKGLDFESIKVETDVNSIMSKINAEVDNFYSTISNFSEEDKVRAMHDINSSLVIAQQKINEALKQDFINNKTENRHINYAKEKDYTNQVTEYKKAFKPIYEKLNEIPGKITQEIKELNYLAQLYNVPTNLSEKQIEKLQECMTEFTSNTNIDGYYSTCEKIAKLEKQNIDYQEVIDEDLEKMFEVLSKTIGDGDDHSARDTEYDEEGIKSDDGTTYSSGLAKDPTSPGSEARQKIIEDIMSIKNRGEFDDVELSTLLQRELKAIKAAQSLELKKFEEEYQKIDENNPDKETLEKLYKDLNDKKEEYKNAIKNYEDNLYKSSTITGRWTGEAVQGTLSGTIENTIDYDRLKTQYEIEIAEIQDKIEKAEKKHELELSRLNDVFDAETRGIIESLSKLDVFLESLVGN